MTRFDRHIIRRLCGSFVLLVAMLIVFFVVLHYVEYVDDFLDRGAPTREVWQVYYPSYIPAIVQLTSPLALFLACVYLTTRLAGAQELLALQTAGVSLYRILWPFALVGLSVTGAMFFFNGWVAPRTNETVVAFESRYLKDGSDVQVSEIHRQLGPGAIINVGFYDRAAHTAHRVSLQRFAAGARLESRTDAARMEWIDSLGVWRLENALTRHFPPNDFEQRTAYAHLDTALAVLPLDFARTERAVEAMTITDAAAFVASLRRSGIGNTGRTLVAYHSKFAYPWANFILVLLGVPLASVRRRGGQAVSIGVGLLVAFAYLAVMKLTEPFGYAGDLPPAVTAWLPHALFFLLALLLLARTRK